MRCLAKDKWKSIRSGDAFDSEKKVKVVAECAHFAGRGSRTENRGAEVKRPPKWPLAMCLHQTRPVQSRAGRLDACRCCSRDRRARTPRRPAHARGHDAATLLSK